MHKFKDGDKVKIKHYCSMSEPGIIYTLVNNNGILFAGNDVILGCSCQDNWILVKPEKPQVYGIVKFLRQYAQV
jgi:hypothetical protein